MNNFNEKVNFIWSVADLIRDVFKRSKYQDVILPFTVLRRIDCVLAPTKQQVLNTYRGIPSDLKNPGPLLTKASGFAFYNISRYDFDALVADSKDLALNLRSYINGFSDNMREVLEKFDFNNTISKLDEAGLLYLVLERFRGIDLHPQSVSNLEMGYIFEELIRKFNEAMNENPGEHFTPREVISLMVDLLLHEESERLNRRGFIALVYDPCCGTGGMLTVAKDHILQVNPTANVALYGQEVNPETFAVCKSDLYMKSADGRDADNIKFGSTLSSDQHLDKRFDYLLSNPPYGKEWKLDQKAVEEEATKGYYGRFGAGLPRISDGQLLFLQHMLGRMRLPEDGGSRVAIVMNGSPLFTGDAGSGESEIRRWILEKDWLEAIIALPEQLFYNTGIATYVWVLCNRKEPRRRGKVQLIDATTFFVQMRKSLGDKRREISAADMERIQALYREFDAADPEYAKVFDTIDFGYRKITVDRPLRLNFHASAERLERLVEESAFKGLATSKKRDPEIKAWEEDAGRKEQARIIAALQTIPDIGACPMTDPLGQTTEPSESLFEQIRQVDDDGLEFWSARDLATAIEYTNWRNFKGVLLKAQIACENSGHDPTDHFVGAIKMVAIGSDAKREVEDMHLSRYACYLVVQNADPAKEVVALGQTYFAVQTRRQEISDAAALAELTEDQRRLLLRQRIKVQNTDLASAAKNAGVITALDFAIFQNHGYRGLYNGLTAEDIHKRKKLKKSQYILDHMGATELAANLFRSTQAEEKLRRDQVQGKDAANQVHYQAGVVVRRAIAELGGTMPEDLPTVDSIKKLERAEKKRLAAPKSTGKKRDDPSS